MRYQASIVIAAALFAGLVTTAVLESSPVTVTFAGTSTLLFEDGESKVLVDGFFTRPSFGRVLFGKVGSEPCAVEMALDRLRVREADLVAVVHSHFDHALDSAQVAACTGATLYGSRSTLMTGSDGQVRKDFAHGAVRVGKFTVTPYHSTHSPMIFFLRDIGETIDRKPDRQARASAYKEGGSYDLLVEHGELRILVKPSAALVPGGRRIPAHLVFLGVGSLGAQDARDQAAYFDQAVDKNFTRLIVPVHWDNFFSPLTEPLRPMPWPLDRVDAALEFVKERAGATPVQKLEAFQTLHMDGRIETRPKADLPKGRCGCKK